MEEAFAGFGGEIEGLLGEVVGEEGGCYGGYESGGGAEAGFVGFAEFGIESAEAVGGCIVR